MTTYVPKDVPRATYRVQFRQGFGFSDAIKIVPYWAKLGISHLYASPLTVARPGSPHGYDVVDPTQLNPELGSDEDFDHLAAALAANNMGLLLDIVPNHTSASADNHWWRDVLTNGRASRYADFFDVDWESEGGKIVLPILGHSLDQAIAEGGVSYDGVSLNVGGVRLPLAPGTSGGAVRSILDQQRYRLSCWRDETPNYRRFFEINYLIGMRVEDPAVFEATHALFLRLLAEGKVQGLRVDHIDGLRDPAAYLAKLRTRATEAAGFVPYIVVEKILGSGEELPAGWPVAGATGYDWLGMANGLLVDGRGMRGLDRAYRAFTGGSSLFGDIVYRLKTSGHGASRVTAFARRHSDHWLIVLAPRLTYTALGRRVAPGPGPGTRPALRLPTGCPTSWRDVLEGKGVRAAGRTLPLARTIKDGVPVVLRNV